MGEGSKIEWTHHTFNPWRGCTHVSPGCEHCYAEALSKRNPAQLGTWGAGGERVIASESYWKQPERWNRAAEKAGDRHRVFCASLADVFEDRPELIEPRWRLFSLIADTPHLDWLLLTKRPENARVLGVGNFWLDINAWRLEQGLSVIPGGMTDIARDGLPNVWLGTTVEDQRRADERIPILLDTPAAVRFRAGGPGRVLDELPSADVGREVPRQLRPCSEARLDHRWRRERPEGAADGTRVGAVARRAGPRGGRAGVREAAREAAGHDVRADRMH